MKQYPNLPEFNVQKIISVKYWPKFIEYFSKFYLSSILKKSLESLVYYNITPKFTDKLTKDVYKSYQRKLLRNNNINSLNLNYKIFYTSLWSQTLSYTSSMIYDILYNSFTYLFFMKNKEKKQITIKKCILWFMKSGLCYTASITCSALGYAIGGYLGGPAYGAPIGQLILESIGNLIAQLTLGMDQK